MPAPGSAGRMHRECGASTNGSGRFVDSEGVTRRYPAPPAAPRRMVKRRCGPARSVASR